MKGKRDFPVTRATSLTSVEGELVPLMGETYYCIRNYDAMPPFFISVVSSDDHWLFVSTTGGLTAGRINADHALFPYYTVDRVEENAANTGPRSILQVRHGETTLLWEPFIPRYYSPYNIERVIYKNIAGTSLIFEEVNADLNLVFRYAWRTSAEFGIVKTAWLLNQNPEAVSITITDGFQNILPAHIESGTQNAFSVLLDAYKRNELDEQTGLGLFSLSSRLTDLAEPSESLRANTVWQVGLESSVILLSSLQLSVIRNGHQPQPEIDIRGRRGAYFVHTSFELEPNTERSWHFVAEVNQDGAAVANLISRLSGEIELYDTVEKDIQVSSERLKHIVGGADGFQVAGDRMGAEHHFANVLFNVMRGGTFADQYRINKADLRKFVNTHNCALEDRHEDFFATLPENLTIWMLKQQADAQVDTDLIRLCYSYLPLTFSRRHGDPSRPWNRFSIHLKNPDGSPQLNYEGNWRDIFQNWEALAYSYPEFIEGMIAVFLNATTPDGYNPYRITRDGIDWEVPAKSNPWANIGYWSDHQIIYLQKLMESFEHFHPGQLRSMLARSIFAYANVPYRIKVYDDIVQDPYRTINFDWDLNQSIEEQVAKHGTDSKLLMDQQGKVFHVSLAEKLLNLLLAKLVNFVPGGGIWMNTQRPEWNDANNALAGKGLSVVTVSYLRRFVVFFRQLLEGYDADLIFTDELHGLFAAVRDTIAACHSSPSVMTDEMRRMILDALGRAGSNYRWKIYSQGFSGERVNLSPEELSTFLVLVQNMLDQTITANRREDALYHAYNTLQLDEGLASINHLDLMLEGQVAVLSSGLLEPNDVVTLLHQLRQSALYREDQHSYILYPDQELAGFVKKNTLTAAEVSDLKLIKILTNRRKPGLVLRDENGQYHFDGDLRNIRDVRGVLDELAENPELDKLVKQESDAILSLFEQTFAHDKFTGRSGSFFAYEGLGSIYWHMTSKLLLAVQGNVHHAAEVSSDALPELIEAYYDIRAGLGFNKTPDVYGAFPLDPYSHTPRNQGAKQPGMTGMVKEEILTRLGELGIVIEDGKIVFNPVLLRPAEFLESSSVLKYWNVDDNAQELAIPDGAFAFTLCRVPIVVQRSNHNQFVVDLHDGTQKTILDHELDAHMSQHIFSHDGFVHQITVHYNPEIA